MNATTPPTPRVNIVTWMYSHPRNDSVSYPQVAGAAGSDEARETYWRCVFSLFHSSHLFHRPSEVRHLLFYNEPPPENLDGVNSNEICEAFQITRVPLTTITRPPTDYYSSWNSQFILLDVLEELSTMLKKGFATDVPLSRKDIFLVLDSDCLFNRPLSAALIKRTMQHKALTYTGAWEASDSLLNGVSTRELKLVAQEMGVACDNFYYHCGEFFCCLGSELERISAEARSAYQTSLIRHEEGKKKFNEEAHLLSYVFHKLGYPPFTANRFVKRLWSVPEIDTQEPSDDDLVVWHLLTEKHGKILDYFNAINREMVALGKFSVSVDHVSKGNEMAAWRMLQRVGLGAPPFINAGYVRAVTLSNLKHFLESKLTLDTYSRQATVVPQAREMQAEFAKAYPSSTAIPLSDPPLLGLGAMPELNILFEEARKAADETMIVELTACSSHATKILALACAGTRKQVYSINVPLNFCTVDHLQRHGMLHQDLKHLGLENTVHIRAQYPFEFLHGLASPEKIGLIVLDGSLPGAVLTHAISHLRTRVDAATSMVRISSPLFALENETVAAAHLQAPYDQLHRALIVVAAEYDKGGILSTALAATLNPATPAPELDTAEKAIGTMPKYVRRYLPTLLSYAGGINGILHYWYGLVRKEHGDFEKALAEFEMAAAARYPLALGTAKRHIDYLRGHLQKSGF